ncbi:MAG: hypothetical protein ABEJ28_06870 [Salinigranum sp.]
MRPFAHLPRPSILAALPRPSILAALPRPSILAAVAALAALALSAPAAAHSGAIRTATQETLAVPTWLFLLTGGGVIGASFLLASFVTDRSFVRYLHEWGHTAPSPTRALRALLRIGGVAGLAAVFGFGFFGPAEPFRNPAVLLVWVGWWGGYVATTYLVGNTWPALNPFRTIADLLPSLGVAYPDRLGAWPAVIGLLALVWVEVVTPLADRPRLLATVVLAYSVATVGGAVVFGADRWFGQVDPVSRTVRLYGRVAPFERTDDGIRLRLPGAALRDVRLDGPDEVAFVVAVLFVTTYDGFVGTGLWGAVARAVAGVGVPPHLVYVVAYLGGFALFYGAYRRSARAARRYGDTYLSAAFLSRRFAPSLLAIAAGYHLAHNLGSFLTLLPTFVVVLGAPLSPPQNPPVLAGLPEAFVGAELAFVLLGHLLAVWVAHATSYDLFPDRLLAIRSQYGVTLVMVAFTMISMWVVSEPYAAPPFLS